MSVVSGTLLGTLTMATPLLLAALGENVVQKAGVVNVGLEGMMLLGAFAATLGAKQTDNPYVGLLCAAVAGVLLALLFAAFAVSLSANQVVVGVVVNLLALGLTGTLYRALFGSTGTFLKVKTLPDVVWNQNLLTPLAILAVPAIWWGLYRTRRGLELRACGEQPTAAEASGVSVTRLRTAAILFGGALAGIAGGYLSVGDVGTFKEDMSAGRGFIALAIVTSGRWSPWGCLAAALIFGFAQALQFQFQALGSSVSAQLFLALPYVVTLAILTFGGRGSQAPVALGRPYRKA